MTNLLAILISMAMLLTGASTATLEEAALGRVVTVGNLAVTRNDEEVDLDLYAVLGATTDGEQALYDFYISKDEQAYLPFQVAVTANSLLMKNDKDSQTLLITEAELENMLSGMMDEETAPIMDVYLNELLPASVDLVGFMQDRDEMAALQEKAQVIYGEVIDRGEGRPGKVEYEDEIYDVNIYDYTVTGSQMGALADAIYASDERLAAYAKAYFDFLAVMPEEYPLQGADSYEALMANIDMTMDLSESIADNGLDMMDGKLTIAMPEMDEPVVYSIHQARFGETEFSTLNFEYTFNDMDCEIYMEYSRDGLDSHAMATLTANPVAETAAETEGEGDAEAEGGLEGDAEDMIYATFDLDVTHDEDTGILEKNANCTFDMPSQDCHVDLSMEGQVDDEWVGATHFAGNLYLGEETMTVDFDVVSTRDQVERRITGDGAVSLEEYSFPALLANVSADASQLSADQDIQALVKLLTRPLSTEAEAVVAEPEVTETEPEDEEPEADKPELTSPIFDWLPEGYEVDDINVDAQYDDVTCTLVNAQTEGTITVDITTSYEEEGTNRYIVKDDGFREVDGMLVTEEDLGEFCMYSADNGEINISIYPDNKDVSATDILNLIIGMHF